jgi:hypothetical protein
MARPIPQVLVKECKLLEWDPDGDTIVVVRQARVKEEAERDRLFSEFAIKRSPDGVSEVYQLPGLELMATECWLTFEDANILLETDGETKKLFAKGMSRLDFKTAWGKLPPELMVEWHAKVLEINTHWNPQGVAAESKN